MNNEYIIINRTTLQKRIEELERQRDEAALAENEYVVGNFTGQIYALYELISSSSQSTPLIPEIEKAFDAGNKRGWSGYPNTDNWTQPMKQDYISNLKLEI